jgi:hypothetical protein
MFILTYGLFLRVGEFNEGWLFVYDNNTNIIFFCQCKTFGLYAKLSEYDGHMNMDMTYADRKNGGTASL